MALRWGIISTGKISHDFVSALQVLPRSDHQIVAVAARSAEDAEEFAKSHNIPKSYGGYLQLALDKDVDIAYIGNLNPQHFEVSKMMLEHGKHVICEKPLTMNEKQTRALIEVSRHKKLLLMEGIWSRSFPLYAELKKMIDSGIIGDVFYVAANLGFNLSGVPRLKLKELGGGTILDLGVYPLQFQQFIYRGHKPVKIVAAGHLNSDGTDDSANAILTYPGGKTAVISSSGISNLTNDAVVVGTKGIIRVPSFGSPTQIITAEKTFEFELPKSPATFNFVNSVGLHFQAEEARRCIKAGKIESPNILHEESIELAQLMDTIRQQLGVVSR